MTSLEVFEDLRQFPASQQEKLQQKDDREQYLFYRKEKTWSEYLNLVPAKLLDTNAKCNRVDSDELEKKQGIVGVIFAEKPLPDFSLILKENKKHWDSSTFLSSEHLSVNDGGHRTRTGLEFEADEFPTAIGTYYHNPENGVKVDIGGMKYSEIAKNHPEAIQIWENTLVDLCISKNADAEDILDDITGRNKNTNMTPAAVRHCIDENVVADFCKFSVREWLDIDGKHHIDSVGIKHHELFHQSVLGFNNKQHTYDEMLARIMLYSSVSNSMVDAGNAELYEFYMKGSKIVGKPGEFVIKEKLFTSVKAKTLEVCDFLYGVLSAWPKTHAFKKTQSLVNALVRWYFEYNNKVLKLNHQTFRWNGEIKIDYQKFALNFSKLMQDIADEDVSNIWTKSEKTKRLKIEAFLGYLTQYNNREKDTVAWNWMKEKFDSICEKSEFGDEREFGITLYDSRPSFDISDIRKRWKEVGECEELNGNPCDINDVHGDHKIPRSAGVRAGGITDYPNLQILLKEDNLSKGAKSDVQFKQESVAA